MAGQRLFQALGALLCCLERAGEFDRALEYAHRGVSLDPLREETHRDLMRLLAATGQPEAALHQYQDLKSLLKTQLGTMPEPTTQALARQIERQALLRPSAIRRLGPPDTSALTSSAFSPGTVTDAENRLAVVLAIRVGNAGPLKGQRSRLQQLLTAAASSFMNNRRASGPTRSRPSVGGVWRPPGSRGRRRAGCRGSDGDPGSGPSPRSADKRGNPDGRGAGRDRRSGAKGGDPDQRARYRWRGMACRTCCPGRNSGRGGNAAPVRGAPSSSRRHLC